LPVFRLGTAILKENYFILLPGASKLNQVCLDDPENFLKQYHLKLIISSLKKNSCISFNKLPIQLTSYYTIYNLKKENP